MNSFEQQSGEDASRREVGHAAEKRSQGDGVECGVFERMRETCVRSALCAVDAWRGFEERSGQLRETVQQRSRAWAGVCIATSALAAGCAGMPKGGTIEDQQYAQGGEQSTESASGANTGREVAGYVLSEVSEYIPNNDAEVVGIAVREGLTAVATSAGPVGMAAFDLLRAAETTHNAACAERAAEALNNAVQVGGGTVVHEGLSIRGSFSVRILDDSELADVYQGDSLESWEGHRYYQESSSALPKPVRLMFALKKPISTLANRAYTDVGRETDAMFSHAKNFGAALFARNYQGRLVLAELQYDEELPLPKDGPFLDSN